MKIINKLFVILTLSFSLAMGSSGAWAVPITQLGFILDASGSISTSNYNLMRSGLSSALAGLPVDGSVEISIVNYGSSVATVVSPTILTALSLGTIQAAITSHSKLGGGTDTAAAITSMTTLLTGSSVFSAADTKSLINLLTDGAPNSQNDAEAASLAAAAAGIDALSIEAIGSGVSSQSALNNMLAMAFPTPATILAVNQASNIPNPIGGSWVVPVSDFNSLAPVLAAKVIASVTPPTNQVPEPSVLALVAIGLLAGMSRRKKSKVC
ncbi:putative secreted protein with PEP-CTERM sorting signal [Nitrosospira sp. Nsp5]|uniref:PEP-CTERM protein-sorting domain-containing protein n=1 Tax=Nitrosospira multiformis TaxID=1231 RepID=A0ABY0TGE5_9PROT|nr:MULTISPECIES: VWA domain-containing protein [Nitrosospira]PTR10624.1 putative secreted protein with PEP-CTERM sorting signal [Nitrosospira sp. Nsp5]SDQ79340.1 PEP-CTERM protein-sorting domain-containing protein [Nitrosospira multiformis]